MLSQRLLWGSEYIVGTQHWPSRAYTLVSGGKLQFDNYRHRGEVYAIAGGIMEDFPEEVMAALSLND